MILNFLFCVGVSVHVVQNILPISAATRILVAIAEATKGHIVMKCCRNKTLGFPFTASLRIFMSLKFGSHGGSTSYSQPGRAACFPFN